MEHGYVGGSDGSIPMESTQLKLRSQACVGVGQYGHQTVEMCQAGVGHSRYGTD